ncbi:MAG: 3-oxoacyl-[acyl-carrier-protein] reductase [Thermodesulfobacteriota bacterium]
MSELPRTALVTGGSRGIGKAIAQRLAERGWQVYFTYVSQKEQAHQVVEGIQAQGGRAQAFALDIQDQQAVADFFREYIQKKVFLDVLVNNAGKTRDGLLLRMKPEDWEDILRINLSGAFFCLQQAAKVMLKQKKGRIINISSVVAQSGNPGQSNYCAAKAGLLGLTKAASLELASRNITVNAVAPGFISTEMTDGLGQEMQQQYLQRVPLGRLGQPEDVANTVAWLASEEAGYVTGQVIGVNGGLYQ